MSNIDSNTRFRKFNFTLYEKLDTLKTHITKLFNTKTCPFSILKFQFETNHNFKEPNKYHAQGFVKVRNNKQLRLGNYNSKTNKGSGIKEIFKANVHVEFANGTDEECLAYCGKFYNRCKNPAHNPNPKKGEKCSEVSGPFEFIFDENKFNSESDEKKMKIIILKQLMKYKKKEILMNWTYFLRLTDRNHCLMDIKHGKTNIVAMYICITANGTIENLYKNLRERNSSIDIEAFIRRVRYIIKFEGNPIDSRIGKGNITRIFEKGNKQDFNNRIFDIEFNRETTLEQAKKVTIDLEIKGTIFQDTATGYYYWRQSWENEINKYSTIENIDDITD
ncbi:hypothetical protein C2G38_2228273 [Gigaspora rosea]|uniref:Uncharacterized protein n=1 Tax=Gigaspora rosea TaxID=44941 RepID=A0A397TW31_9GLOM|nr:hypothetical protein C2G38_2228273 [Gigaspora rosea]